ncbi:MAG TPA: peptidoglycan-associated lipoprotein Pal [Alphaproteobacteria bacterium]|nr:peptidoglycan-associated lipoprotein Pal [Alphaproteobacteria bacterium]
MKNFALILTLAASLTLTSCSWFKKDKPNEVTDESLLPSDQLAGSDMNAMENVDGANTSTINTGAQEELIAVAGDRVFFGYDSSTLTSEGEATIRKQANWLNQNTGVNVTVEGHCDERGTREYNLALGEKRAQAVKNALINNGVNPSRVNTISYGKEFPEFLGSSEESWAKNRRGVTVVN